MTPSPLKIFAPEQLLPAQFLPDPNLTSGFRALLWALLDDCRLCLQRAQSVRRFGELRQAYKDSQWVRSDVVAPFSFCWVLQHLGLDPAAMRATLAPYLRDEKPRSPLFRSGRTGTAERYYVHLPNARALGRSRSKLRVQIGEREGLVPLRFIAEDSEVLCPGDTGTLTCFRTTARRLGFLPPHDYRPRVFFKRSTHKERL